MTPGTTKGRSVTVSRIGRMRGSRSVATTSVGRVTTSATTTVSTASSAERPIVDANSGRVTSVPSGFHEKLPPMVSAKRRVAKTGTAR